MQTQLPAQQAKQNQSQIEHKLQQPLQAQFEDARPETTAQLRMQSLMANSAQSTQLKSMQAMMAANTPAKKLGQSPCAINPIPLQRMEDEEPLQAKADEPVQREQAEAPPEPPLPPKPNNTGLPDNLKSGIENLSGMSMDHVKVHYNSDKPAQLQAHAYAQGSEIHVAPGQEKHLPHEAWHVVQQAQGRVRPTVQMKGGVGVNDDEGLEREADIMGGRALQMEEQNTRPNDPVSLTEENSIQAKPVGPIQFAPPGAFTALGVRLPGTAIPANHNGWIKPRWLRGADGGAMTMRNALLATKVPEMVVAGQAFYRCCLCGKLADSNGMAVDHATDWKEWCVMKGSADLQQLEYNFHDLDNLHVTHTNCNSSKSQEDLFAWWNSARAEPYMDPATLQTVRHTINRIFHLYGIDWLYEIPAERRIQVVNAIIEDALSKDAFQKIMANGKIADQLGWKGSHGDGGDDDEGMGGDGATA